VRFISLTGLQFLLHGVRRFLSLFAYPLNISAETVNRLQATFVPNRTNISVAKIIERIVHLLFLDLIFNTNYAEHYLCRTLR
jgi:hypothetical protein